MTEQGMLSERSETTFGIRDRRDSQMIDMPRIQFSSLPEPQRISDHEGIWLMGGAPTRDIVDHGVTHAITPDGAVIEVSDNGPPEWIGNLVKSSWK